MQKTCTVVIVAHRLTTVIDCDKIFVLDKHKIAGYGTHTELLKSCKVYKNLYDTDDLE